MRSLMGAFAVGIAALFLFMIASFANGCVHMDAKAIETCGDSAGSVIQKYIDDPAMADLILTMANFEAIEAGTYTVNDAERGGRA